MHWAAQLMLFLLEFKENLSDSLKSGWEHLDFSEKFNLNVNFQPKKKEKLLVKYFVNTPFSQPTLF